MPKKSSKKKCKLKGGAFDLVDTDTIPQVFATYHNVSDIKSSFRHIGYRCTLGDETLAKYFGIANKNVVRAKLSRNIDKLVDEYREKQTVTVSKLIDEAIQKVQDELKVARKPIPCQISIPPAPPAPAAPAAPIKNKRKTNPNRTSSEDDKVMGALTDMLAKGVSISKPRQLTMRQYVAPFERALEEQTQDKRIAHIAHIAEKKRLERQMQRDDAMLAREMEGIQLTVRNPQERERLQGLAQNAAEIADLTKSLKGLSFSPKKRTKRGAKQHKP